MKRTIVIAATGLVMCAATLTALGCDSGPVTKPAPEEQEVPAPSLPKVDAALLEHPAPTQPSLLPFLNREQPAVKISGTLREGEKVTQMAFTPDGKLLVAIDYDDMHLRVWDWRNSKLVSKQKHANRFTGLAIDPRGQGAWTTDAYGNLDWWSLAADGQLGAATHVGDKLGSQPEIAVSPNGSLLATASYNKQFALWDTAGRTKLAQITTDEHLRACAFSPDGKRLVVGTSTNLLLEYELATGKGRKLHIPPVKPDSDLMALGFSPDGKRFSTGHNQPWITVWQGGGMTYQRWLKCPETGGIWALEYTRDSSLLAFALTSGELFLWDPDNREEAGRVASLNGHESLIRSLAFSPDGRVLASGDDGGVIHLWSGGQ